MGCELDSDAILVEQARNGSPEAFDALFHRHLDMVRGEARRCGLGSAEGDVVQESFLRAYLRLRDLKEPAKFASWLQTIARRVCLAEQRLRSHHAASIDDNACHPERAERDEIRQLFALLPPEDREPLYLHHVLGLDTDSAAKAMGISPGAFRVRLHRIRKRAGVLAQVQWIEEGVVMRGERLEGLPDALVAAALSKPADPGAWRDDWPTFRSLVEYAHRTDPTNSDAALLLGRKLACDGEYQAALKVLRPLWGRAPSTWCGLTIAWCLDYTGHRREAVQWYGRVLALPSLDETERAAAMAGIEAGQRPKVRPAPPDGVGEMAATGWTATASHEALAPARAIDGSTRTCWSPMGDQQTPGMWFRIDLGEQVEGLAGIWLDDDAGGQSIHQNAAPRHCLVSVSADGEWWKRVGEWQWQPNRYMEAWWEPVSARHVLLEQVGRAAPYWWCIYEAHLFRAKPVA